MSALGPPPASSVTVAEAPSDIGWQALRPAIACTILAFIVVMLRWYIRLSLTRRVLSIAMTSVYLHIFSGGLLRYGCEIILISLLGALFWGIYWLSAMGINIMMDSVIRLLPMPIIGQLRLPTRPKIGRVAVFATGGFVCSGVAAVVWSAVETNVGIMYASMLAMKLLLAASTCMRLPTVTDNLGQLTTSDTTCVASRNAPAESTSQTLEIKVVTETVLRHSNSRFLTPFPHGLMPGPISSVL
ncbi:uncharacterized protein K441DRAFT_709747 [Cenococcum geophilum 1.58]|uniref:Uncharacterized protein n=1 Tax=Cenococcum geophilum 1.58 TaxID=794803 RepID=A0ACC8EKH0_9PEZI|nr:hypothetical protein K441DRAFT_709747 [Cenococcum geophilum 1.58]